MRTNTRTHSIHSGPLILVDALHPCGGDAPTLVSVGEREGGVLLERRAAALLQKLMGEIGGWSHIVAVSGWRSQAEQQKIWDDTLKTQGEAFTRQYVALPGHSEHQTGLAIDLGLRQETVDFIRPDFPDWGVCGHFRRRAAAYGFILRYPAGKEAVTGISHEPWHFRYVGAPHGEIITAMGVTLEEYHAFLRDFPYGGRPLTYRTGGLRFAVSHLALEEGEPLPTSLLEDPGIMLSGNNVDGYLVTTWGEA